MYVTRLEVRNWRAIDELALDLAPGLNILWGPNESGKSSVREALRAAFLYPSSSRGRTAMAAARPWGRTTARPRVDVSFIHQGEEWKLRKVFFAKGSELFHNGHLVVRDDDVHARVLQTFSDVGFSVLWSIQGDLGLAEVPSELRPHLAATEAVTPGVTWLQNHVQELFDIYWTSSRGDARRPLTDARERTYKAETLIRQLQAQLREADRISGEAEELDARRLALLDRERAARAEVDEAREQVVAWEAYRRQMAECQALEADARQVQQWLDRWDAQRRALAGLRERVGTFQLELAAAREALGEEPSRAPIERLERRRLYAGARIQHLGFEELRALRAPSPEQVETLQALENRLQALREAREQLAALADTGREVAEVQARLDALCQRERELQGDLDQRREALELHRRGLESAVREKQAQSERLERGLSRWAEQRNELLDLVKRVEAHEEELEMLRRDLTEAGERERSLAEDLQRLQQATEEQGRTQADERRQLEQQLTDLQRALQRWQTVRRPLAEALAEQRTYQQKLEAAKEHLSPPDRRSLDEVRQRLAYAVDRQQRLLQEQLEAVDGLDRTAVENLDRLSEAARQLEEALREITAIQAELAQTHDQERDLETQLQEEKARERSLDAEVRTQSDTHDEQKEAVRQYERGLQRWVTLRQRFLDLSQRLATHRAEEERLAEEVGTSLGRGDLEALQARQRYCKGRRHLALQKELEALAPPSPEQLADVEQLQAKLQAVEAAASVAPAGPSSTVLAAVALALIVMAAGLGWFLKGDAIGLGAGAVVGLVAAAIVWASGSSRGTAARKLTEERQELDDRLKARLAELRITDLADGRRREQQANALRAAIEGSPSEDIASLRDRINDAQALDEMNAAALATELQAVADRIASEEQRLTASQRAHEQVRARREQLQRESPEPLLRAALESLLELQAEVPTLSLPSPTLEDPLEEAQAPLEPLESHLERLRAVHAEGAERLTEQRAKHDESRRRMAELTGLQQRQSGIGSTHRTRLEALRKTIARLLELPDSSEMGGEELVRQVERRHVDTCAELDEMKTRLRVSSVEEARERLVHVEGLRTRLLPPQERPAAVPDFDGGDLAALALDELQPALQSLREQAHEEENRWREAEQRHGANRADYDRLLQENPEKVLTRLQDQLRALVTEEPTLGLTGDLADVENEDVAVKIEARINDVQSHLDRLTVATGDGGERGGALARLEELESAAQTARKRHAELRTAYEGKLRDNPRPVLDKQPEQFRQLAREYPELLLEVAETLTPQWTEEVRSDRVGERVQVDLKQAKAELEALKSELAAVQADLPQNEELTTVSAEVASSRETLQQARGLWKAHASRFNRLCETERLHLEPVAEAPTGLEAEIRQAQADLDEEAAKRQHLLTTLGVYSLADARAREEGARELRARLDEQPPTTEELERLRAACEDAEAVDAMDSTALHRELAALPQRIQDAEKQWTAANRKFVEARKTLEQKLGENPETALPAVLQQFQSLADEYPELVGPVNEQTANDEGATAAVRALLETKQEAVRVHRAALQAPTDSEEACQQGLVNAQKGQRTAQEAREAISADLQQRLGSLEAHADLYSRVARAEEEHQRAAADQRKVEREAGVLKLLHDAIESSRQEVETDLVGPLRERIGHRLAQITAGRYHGIKMEPDFRVDTLLTAERTQAPLVDVSFGTKEQMAFLSRLCLAEMLSDKERNLVVFDDNLVHTDEARMEVACEVLREVAEKAQILLLTCHPERFEPLRNFATAIDALKR